MVDYLEEGRILCRTKVAAPGDCAEKTRKIDSRCSALAR